MGGRSMVVGLGAEGSVHPLHSLRRRQGGQAAEPGASSTGGCSRLGQAHCRLQTAARQRGRRDLPLAPMCEASCVCLLLLNCPPTPSHTQAPPPSTCLHGWVVGGRKHEAHTRLLDAASHALGPNLHRHAQRLQHVGAAAQAGHCGGRQRGCGAAQAGRQAHRGGQCRAQLVGWAGAAGRAASLPVRQARPRLPRLLNGTATPSAPTPTPSPYPTGCRAWPPLRPLPQQSRWPPWRC